MINVPGTEMQNYPQLRTTDVEVFWIYNPNKKYLTLDILINCLIQFEHLNICFKMNEKLCQENLHLSQMGIKYYLSIHFSGSQKLGLRVAVYTDKNIPKVITLFLAELLAQGWNNTIRQLPSSA